MCHIIEQIEFQMNLKVKSKNNLNEYFSNLWIREGFQSRKAMKVIPEEKMDKFDNKNLYRQII